MREIHSEQHKKLNKDGIVQRTLEAKALTLQGLCLAAPDEQSVAHEDGEFDQASS
jgi:hypothetical protein